MIKNRESFFIQLAKHPLLKDNLLSLILAKNPNIDISKRETFVDNISRFYSIHKLDEKFQLQDTTSTSTSTLDEWLNQDLRIKKIKLQSVRGFPKSHTPYGINFTNANEKISSMVILGGNATGKSSIYDAIEYIFCKRIGEAELRTTEKLSDEDERFQEFLRHFNNSYSDATCEIATNSKTFLLNEINIPKDVRDKINPNTHFISDFDLHEIGKLNYQRKGDFTFQNLIAKNVGLSEYLEIEKNLYQFTSYRRLIESNNVSKLNKEIETANNIIANNTKAIEVKLTQQKSLIDTSQAQNKNNEITSLLDLVEKLKRQSLRYFFDYSNFKSVAESFKDQYAQYMTLSTKTGSLQEIQFLEIGISLLANHDNCPFCNNSNSSKEEIARYVRMKVEEIKNLARWLLLTNY